LAQKYHPNVIVMDLSMPVMNGLEAAKVLRKLMPSVPLIMFTFFSTCNLERQALEAGYRKVVLKTERLEELVSSIRSLLVEAA
jgi:DNA-binding NarL/FixJ family response regulator